MDHQEVAGGLIGAPLVPEPRTSVDAPLHLVHVDEACSAPHVAGLDVEGAPACGLCLRVEVALLETERVHPEHEPEQPAGRIPGEENACGAIAQAAATL